MMRISTSETIMITGARRFRTAKFMRMAWRESRDGGRNLCRLMLARRPAVVTFVDQFDDERFHLDRHHLYLPGKVGKPDQRWHRNRKSKHCSVQCFSNPERNLTGVRRAGAQPQVGK